MPDREKVIKALACCVSPVSKGFPYQSHIADTGCEAVECPYLGDCDQMLLDALELLEGKEPQPPRIAQTADKIFYACDSCGKSLFVIVDSGNLNASSVFPKFCPECGQAVKWEIHAMKKLED